MGIAYLHRPWNLHPGGGFMGLGTSPGKIILSLLDSTSGSGTGIADIRAFVYGCRAFLYSSSLDANSTITPRYMTATLFEICLTMERSWDINRYVKSKFSCSSMSKFTI